MIKLIVDNNRPRPALTIVNSDPQERLDALCNKCFLVRGYYLEAISKKVPFDLTRAIEIADTLSAKGARDPKSYALAHALRRAIAVLK
jgi:hypothetical protein